MAYTVLGAGVPVTASDGKKVGTVHHVVAAPEKDIFHGIVLATGGFGRRFVEAADVASIHEGGVDLQHRLGGHARTARAQRRRPCVCGRSGDDQHLEPLGAPPDGPQRLEVARLSTRAPESLSESGR